MWSDRSTHIVMLLPTINWLRLKQRDLQNFGSACMSSFKEHGKSFKIIELERLTSFEFIQEHAPRPNLQQTQNRDSDTETGFLKIPTAFDLLLALSLKK